MNFEIKDVITFLGGGIVVFLLEQAIRFFRRERRILGYTVNTRTLVEKSDPDLKLEYKGMEVEKVYSHEVRIKNIGNACLKEVPVFIMPSPGKFFFAKIEAKPGIHCPKLEGEPGCAFEFNLLNPNDEIKVELVVLDSSDSKLKIDARSEHLKVREIADSLSVTQVLEVALEGSSGISWTAIKLASLMIKR
ncbi:hypothetical protein [Cerasicoccus frondis]|uniref:hypothetical protein n=1 Tax=Cerasicoccus frondis TaxID=490090 RepID=UPI0028528033|nr:hypothetical protein [Cerasicoccus frondis]